MWFSVHGCHNFTSPSAHSRYLERIIRLSELAEFAAILAPHQLATTADGQYILSFFE